MTLAATASAGLATVAPVLALGIAFWLLTAALNWVLWWETTDAWERWAEAHPKRAWIVRSLRAVFPHLRKLLVAGRDAAAAQARVRGLPPPEPVAGDTEPTHRSDR